MTSNTQRVPRLQGSGLQADAELAALVRAANELAVAVEARTPLGSGKGPVKRLGNGFLLGGAGRGMGGGGGALPPFYATGGRGKVRVNWGVCFSQALNGRVPFMAGQDLRENPVLDVGPFAWVVLRVKFDLVWKLVPVGEEMVEVLDTLEVDPSPDGVVILARATRPEFQVNVTKERVELSMVVARVANNRVQPILRNDVQMDLAGGEIFPVFPTMPRGRLILLGWEENRKPEDFL